MHNEVLSYMYMYANILPIQFIYIGEITLTHYFFLLLMAIELSGVQFNL